MSDDSKAPRTLWFARAVRTEPQRHGRVGQHERRARPRLPLRPRKRVDQLAVGPKLDGGLALGGGAPRVELQPEARRCRRADRVFGVAARRVRVAALHRHRRRLQLEVLRRFEVGLGPDVKRAHGRRSVNRQHERAFALAADRPHAPTAGISPSPPVKHQPSRLPDRDTFHPCAQ